MSLLEKRLRNRRSNVKNKVVDNKNSPKNTPRRLTNIQKEKKNVEIYLRENKLPILKLDKVSFSIYDNETFSKKSIVDIENPNRNVDLYSSLEDPRLGTIDPWQLCSYCEKTTEECTGHFSRINLGFNFIHPLYRSIVVMVLQSICHCCNKLLLKEPIILENGLRNKKGFDRLRAFKELSINKTCNGINCGSKIIFKPAEANNNARRSITYYIKKGNEKSESKQMSVDTVLTRLKAISDEDIKTLGFNTVHPKNFIIDYVPVIPITDRPPGITETEKKDHALTYAYNDILSKYLESKYHISLDDQEDCYNKIVNIYNAIIVNKKNEPTTYTRNQQEPIEAIKDMINRKEGIIRNNLLAKRCDFTGRSVLGPSDVLNFGWLGLAKRMGEITVPEFITHYNYNYIQKIAKEGRIKFLCPKKGSLAGRKLKFDYEMHSNKLYIGDKIQRTLEDNDVLTFNRAPTLQPQSMLGFKIQLQDKESIGVHLSSTKGLNADFDGDEGNVHLIQTPEAQCEARLVMNVENNIISYSNSAPEAALFINSVISAFLMTDDKVFLEKEEFERGVDYVNSRLKSDYVLNNYKSLENRCKEINPLSGKALFSILLPPDFWYQRIVKDKEVYISDGVLRKGRIVDKHIDSKHFSIISNLHKNYGHEITAVFISAANFLLNWYIYRIGFTISFKDVTLREYTKDFKEKRKAIIEATNKILMKKKDTIVYTLLEKENLNRDIFNEFENTKKKIDKLVSSMLDLNNSIFLMVNSGAKGSQAKAIEIVGSKSFISVNSALVEKTMTKNKRWLTTYSVDDYRLESRGFSVNSYYEGLDVDAYFAECQSGRGGLIDTAVKTAQVGYMQRKMVKAQEDLIINYDGSVRNQKDVIFEFSYGANFKTNEMVLDNSDDHFSIFSFVNVKDMVGKFNYKNGLDFDFNEKIKDLAKNINKKYGFEDKEIKLIEDIDEDNNEKLYVEDIEDEEIEVEDIDY